MRFPASQLLYRLLFIYMQFVVIEKAHKPEWGNWGWMVPCQWPHCRQDLNLIWAETASRWRGMPCFCWSNTRRTAAFWFEIFTVQGGSHLAGRTDRVGYHQHRYGIKNHVSVKYIPTMRIGVYWEEIGPKTDPCRTPMEINFCLHSSCNNTFSDVSLRYLKILWY